MNIYTARQPIFNRKEKVVAYELLFRDSETNSFPQGIDPDVATSKLLINSFLNMDIDTVTNKKAALVNFPANLLQNGFTEIMDSEKIIIEVLETVGPTDEIFEWIKGLHKNKYKIALDDFIYTPEWDRFFPFIKLIKIDIQETPVDEAIEVLNDLQIRFPALRFLAEKVETKEEYEKCYNAGFHFFQGYYICKPEIVKGKSFTLNSNIFMRVYAEVMRDNFSYKKVADLIKFDPVLTEKLLKYVNSPMYMPSQEVTSIKQAIGLLGEIQLRRVICLLSSYELCKNKPDELVRIAIIRSLFGEQIAKRSKIKIDIESAYVTGLMSTIDAILDSEMSDIMSSLPLSKEIKSALISNDGDLGHMNLLVKHYELGSWELVEYYRGIIDISKEDLSNAYNISIQEQEKQYSAISN